MCGMTSRERILNQIAGKPVDRIPMLGGWNLGVDNICNLAEITRDEYVANPFEAVMQANRNLHVDSLVLSPIVPNPESELRTCLIEEHNFEKIEPETLLEDANRIPDTEKEIVTKYDTAEIEVGLRSQYANFISKIGEMAVIPTHWNSIANFSLYGKYGYEAFLGATALYPEAVEKIFWESSIHTREFNKILLKMFEEFNLPPVLFCGCDICIGQGPLVSPRFLKEHYWQHAKNSIKPLLDAGIRLVYHCDGNVMPIIEDVVKIGFSGFQGFQYEFGVDPYKIRESVKGCPPLFFAGLSVTKTLPSGTVEDVKKEVEYAMDFTRGGEGLFLFTSNVTGIDVPVENLKAAYAHQETLVPGSVITTKWQEWPWQTA